MQREELPCDVLFVGAGPACLAGAIHLVDQVAAHNEAVGSGAREGSPLEMPTIFVIEKGSEVGAHQLSGAVLDPKALDELVPDWRTREDFPLETWVEREKLVFLTPTGHIEAPWIPPELENHGKPVIALGRLVKWLAGIAESKGITILPGFAGNSVLWEGDRVIGVRTGDKGVDKHGAPRETFEPGVDIKARVTIIGEGPRGHLTRRVVQRRRLDAASQPMAYEIGVKEVLELPKGTFTEGFVMHTLGFPLDLNTFGGSFVYTMADDKVCIGLLTGLDAHDPQMDAHAQLQQLKNHPYIRSLIGKGKVVKYGAKAVTIGGWASIPQLYTDGCMLVGDGASFLNPMRIKGIHLSMKSGMLAAEAAFDALVANDPSEAVLKAYKARLDASWIRPELESAKNMHANFHNGFVGGMFRTAVQYFLGSGEKSTAFEPDYRGMRTLAEYGSAPPPKLEYDGVYLLDKLTDVYHSGTKHDEHQPSHLKIIDTNVCATTCKEQFGNPCTKFCPAQVYNMRHSDKSGRLEMEVDFGNCVHCKTCDIRDPYQIITWVPPEGGNGPEYGYL
jgi:electron-transferring-flavoprotein dehydrogenase